MLFDQAKSDTEKSLFKVIYKLFTKTELEFNGSRVKRNMGVFQGSVLGPALFKFYLYQALMSNKRLKMEIHLKRLWAFADDLIIGFYNKFELELII